MSFDDIPEDMRLSMECERCGGSITETSPGLWECDTCTWFQRAGNKPNSTERDYTNPGKRTERNKP